MVKKIEWEALSYFVMTTKFEQRINISIFMYFYRSRRSVSSSYVQPSLGAVHRALFDDS